MILLSLLLAIAQYTCLGMAFWTRRSRPFHKTASVFTLSGRDLTIFRQKVRPSLKTGWVRVIALMLLSMSCVKVLTALDRSRPAFHYLQAAWTQAEGSALPAIQAIAQTADGYVWLGTHTGLIRFDGVRFVRWESSLGGRLPDTDVRSLLASSQGGLWVGTVAGVCRRDRGRIIRYAAADRLIKGLVFAMAEDSSGSLWVITLQETNTSLAVLRPDGSVQAYGSADGLPDRLKAFVPDQAGYLWMGTDKGLCRWRPGNRAICSSSASVQVQSVIEGAAGELLMTDIAGRKVLRLRNGKLESMVTGLENTSLSPRVLMRDRKGSIWIGTVGQGLLRFSDGRLERFTHRDGLSSDLTTSLMEDREGNVWAGTAKGIDRFRDPEILHFSSLDGLSSDVTFSVCATPDGATWVGTAGGGLNRILKGKITQYLMKSGLPSTTVLSLYADQDGRLWAGTTAGLAYLSGNRFVEVRGPDGMPLHRVFALTGDRTGTIWLADSKAGLVRIRKGIATALSLGGEDKKIYKLLATHDGTVWIGLYQGGVVALRGGETKSYGTQQGLGDGAVQAMYEDRGGVLWVGASSGLSRFRNGSWTTWASGQGLREGVQGIIGDNRGGLWVVTASGLSRLPLDELEQSRDGSPLQLTFAQYRHTHELRLASGSGMSGPQMSRSEDGRIWISTEDGVAVLDPERIRANPVAPPVVIEQMVIDGKPIDTTSIAEGVFRGRELQITYTALSLTVPEQVRFKYRLEGIDKDWTDAGTRRNVAYVNLPPARYRFQVIACNNDGVWNTAGASFGFRLVPYFYQTTWFAGLCAAVLAILIWGGHKLRVRRLLYRFQLAAQERASITRELHDSLLQGFSGVVYQLEAAARQFESDPEMSKQRLERAIDQADQSLLEARRSLMSMRIAALENSSLAEALSAIGAKLTEDTPTTFRLIVKGHVQQLGYDAQANIYLIGREAITNAVNHSGARRIMAQLVYADKEVRLLVQDDGVGFDPEAALEKKDHWGVAGMQERAKQIAATFDLETESGRGTRIAVCVRK
jgi:signal transduction histidine kinase/ligand-binding sensor domain-containing protein